VSEVEQETPPVGEEIHLPGPTAIPIVMAIGITLTVCGTTINWLMSALGGVIFIVTAAMWIRDTKRDVDALPEDHSAH
jgi:chromate transport protein ChrA